MGRPRQGGCCGDRAPQAALCVNSLLPPLLTSLALSFPCRVGQYGEGERPKDAAELASRLLCSVYMGTEVRREGCCCACPQTRFRFCTRVSHTCSGAQFKPPGRSCSGASNQSIATCACAPRRTAAGRRRTEQQRWQSRCAGTWPMHSSLMRLPDGLQAWVEIWRAAATSDARLHPQLRTKAIAVPLYVHRSGSIT